MANFIITGNPMVIAPGDQDNNAFIIPLNFFRDPRVEKLITVKVTAGSFKVNANGPVNADSPELLADEVYPAFQAGVTSNSDGLIAFHFVDQDGSGSMIVTVI